jgi:MFS family permease
VPPVRREQGLDEGARDGVREGRRAPLPAASRRALVTTGAATTAAVLPIFLVGSQGVQIRRDLGIDEAQLGLVVALAWIAAALGSAPFGRVAQRVGGERTLRAAALGTAAVGAAIAAFADTVAILAVLVAAAGLANAATQPSANLVITRAVPPDRQGLGFAIKQGAIPAATLLGGLAVPVISLQVGWRWTFVIGAGLASLAALGMRAIPGEELPVPAAPDGRGGPAAPGATHPSEAEPSSRAPVRDLALLAVGVGAGAAAAGGMAQFLVSGAVDAGMEEGHAGLVLTLASVFGLAVRLVMGARADRRGGDHLLTVSRMLLGGAVAMAALAVGAPLAYVLAAPVAFGAGWAWPGLFNFAIVQRHPDRPAVATGITQTGTYLGAGTGPLVFGWIVDHASYATAWSVTAGWAVLAATAITAARANDARARVALHQAPAAAGR